MYNIWCPWFIQAVSNRLASNCQVRYVRRANSLNILLWMRCGGGRLLISRYLTFSHEVWIKASIEVELGARFRLKTSSFNSFKFSIVCTEYKNHCVTKYIFHYVYKINHDTAYVCQMVLLKWASNGATEAEATNCIHAYTKLKGCGLTLTTSLPPSYI